MLISEATFSAEQEDLAFQYFHSTTKQAATLAKEGNVNQLIMTHISSRYQLTDYKDLLKEAREIFPDTVLANDFIIIKLVNR